ncbi:MAG: type II toxin-antitoxin system PemK/MazF family toxin, partial [Edaphobacter sp.]
LESWNTGIARGVIVTVASPGDFGKPRPTLVIQAHFPRNPELITVALITSDLLRAPDVRVSVKPTAANGLRKDSEIAVDNIQTFARRRIGAVIGRVSSETMAQVDAALVIFLGLA